MTDLTTMWMLYGLGLFGCIGGSFPALLTMYRACVLGLLVFIAQLVIA